MSDPAAPAEPAEDGAPAPPSEDAGDHAGSAPATEPGDETTEDVPNPTDSAPGTEANGDEDDSAASPSPAADADAAAESPEEDTEAPVADAAVEKETDDADATAGVGDDPATTADGDPGEDDGDPADAPPPEARTLASPETETTDAETDAGRDVEADPTETGDAEEADPLGDAEAPDAALSGVSDSGEESDRLSDDLSDVFSDGDGGSSSSPPLASRRIEGFDDDFRVRPEGGSIASSDDDAAVEGLRGLVLREEDREGFVDPVEQLDALVRRTALERDALRAETAALEVRVATALAKKRGEKLARRPGGAGLSESSEEAKEDEAEYAASLARWREMTSLRDARAAAFDRERSDLTARLRDASAEADAARAAFVDRLEATAKTAQHEKTGKALAAAAARRRLAEERDAEASLSRARLALIESTRARLALERAVREKEHLGGGLKLIDHEQLKMETTALKEKFLERAGDYEKIKRKTSDVAQALTHAKEKLRFTREENRELTEEMERVDRQSKVKGDVMQRLKDEIAAFKRENEAMQSEAATITDATLLDDYADKKRDAREAKARLAEVSAELEAMSRLETTNTKERTKAFVGGKTSERTNERARPKKKAGESRDPKPSGDASAAARRAAGPRATPLLEL